jgi:hypothetical protein
VDPAPGESLAGGRGDKGTGGWRFVALGLVPDSAHSALKGTQKVGCGRWDGDGEELSLFLVEKRVEDKVLIEHIPACMHVHRTPCMQSLMAALTVTTALSTCDAKLTQ